MTELHINLSISALTLVVACSIGLLAEGFYRYLDQPAIASLAVEYKSPVGDATPPLNSGDADDKTAPAADKVAMK